MCSAILHEIVVDTNLIIPYLCLDQLPQHNTCTAKIIHQQDTFNTITTILLYLHENNVSILNYQYDMTIHP